MGWNKDTLVGKAILSQAGMNQAKGPTSKYGLWQVYIACGFLPLYGLLECTSFALEELSTKV